MIDVAWLIERIRERVRDTKEPYAYSDDLLRATIAQEQIYILAAFNQGVSHYAKELDFDNYIALPRTACKILKAFINGRAIRQKGIGSALENRAERDNELCLVPLSMQTYMIAPSHRAQGLLEIFFIPSQEVSADTKELILEQPFSELLILGVMRTLYSLETNEANLQRISFFSQAYSVEQGRLMRLVSSLNSNDMVMTRFVF